jgi:outer membrane protein assembly factor BamD (BamD/ComL family)
VDRELRPFAWQQAVVAAIGATNAPAASRAMERLLATSPDAEVSGRSALLVGQSLLRQGEGLQGRELLSRFAERFSDAKVTAEVRLALAEGYLADRMWTNVLRELDGWVLRYTNHPALPQAEYDRAMATAEAGMATNAVEQFRLLAQRFATNPLSQTAQLWLGEHFFSQGDYAQAELACVGVMSSYRQTTSR